MITKVCSSFPIFRGTETPEIGWILRLITCILFDQKHSLSLSGTHSASVVSFNVSHCDYLGKLGVAGVIVIMCPVDRFRPVVQRLADGGSRTRSSPAEMEILMPEPGEIYGQST